MASLWDENMVIDQTNKYFHEFAIKIVVQQFLGRCDHGCGLCRFCPCYQSFDLRNWIQKTNKWYTQTQSHGSKSSVGFQLRVCLPVTHLSDLNGQSPTPFPYRIISIFSPPSTSPAVSLSHLKGLVPTWFVSCCPLVSSCVSHLSRIQSVPGSIMISFLHLILLIKCYETNFNSQRFP